MFEFTPENEHNYETHVVACREETLAQGKRWNNHVHGYHERLWCQAWLRRHQENARRDAIAVRATGAALPAAPAAQPRVHAAVQSR